MPGGVQGLDRYAYVNNSPIRYSDPSGHFSEDEIDRYLKSTGIKDAKERQKIINNWKKDTEWWKIIGPGGATYGDVIDGSNLLGTHVYIQFWRNEADDTFGIEGCQQTLELPGNGGSLSIEEINNQNYDLVKFYTETRDVLWLRPVENRLTFQGGTGNATGSGVQWEEAGSAVNYGVTAFGLSVSGVGLLAAPEPTFATKAAGLTLFALAMTQFLQEVQAMSRFHGSIDATYRLYLLENYYRVR